MGWFGFGGCFGVEGVLKKGNWILGFGNWVLGLYVFLDWGKLGILVFGGMGFGAN